MVDYEIIQASHENIEGIVHVWEAFMDFHAELDPFFTRHSQGSERFREHLGNSINLDNAFVLAVLSGGNVVGYSISSVSLYPPVLREMAYGFISDMAVSKDFREKGIGKAMLKEIELWFKGQGITRIEIRALSNNEIGIDFWEGSGYKEYVKVMYKEIQY